jgi:flagellar hook-basal body complex protein FliE
MTSIKGIESKAVAATTGVKSNVPSEMGVNFNDLLDDAVQKSTQKDATLAQLVPYAKPLSSEEQAVFAQVITGDDIDAIRRRRQRFEEKETELIDLESDADQNLRTKRLDQTPFQLFLDKVVDMLESVSTMEFKVNDLTEQYIRGEASIDEVSMETAKLNLSISFVTTVITQTKDTLKEILGMQV